MDLPWLWDSFFFFFPNYRDSSVGPQVRQSCQVRLLIHIHPPGLADLPHLSQPPPLSHQRRFHPLPGGTQSLSTPGKRNHEQNPSFEWKADGIMGEEGGAKTCYCTRNETSCPVGHLLFTCFSLCWEKGHDESLLRGCAPFPKIAKEL